MGTKVKGLLKGLRYISNIFESDNKEPEMQIGFPTDVKHVAHIGWDGPSVSTPDWMNDFKSASSEQLCASTTGERNMVHPSSSSTSQGAGISSASDTASVVAVPKPSRRNHSSASAEASTGSPRDSRRRESRHSRRNQSASATTDSPDREKSNRGSRRSRKERNVTTGGSSEMAYYTAPSSPLQDKNIEDKVCTEDNPKQKPRKGKSSSSSSSTSSSTSKSKTKQKDGEKVRARGLKPVKEDSNEG